MTCKHDTDIDAQLCNKCKANTATPGPVDDIEAKMLVLEKRLALLHRRRNELLGISVETEECVRGDAALVSMDDPDLDVADNAIVERVSDGYWVHARVWVGEL